MRLFFLVMESLSLLILCGVAAAGAPQDDAADQTRPNILFISVDDMNCDSIGAFGCQLDDTTPNIDQLAAEGLRFRYAHVQVGNCMPSRNVMFSGRYPHNNRVEGFYQVKNPGYPVLVDLMKEHGYFTAIRGKVSHSTPYRPYDWDLILDGTKPQPKNVQSYYAATKKGIAASREAGKPFCILINVSDPHKPFYAMGRQGQVVPDANVPSRVFTVDEVPIPGFLFDHPDVRKELAHYYSSVRRADDCVGAALKALTESGQRDNTVVVFLSDHGMPLPFAKTAVYHHSTHTPWIVRWPGVTEANRIDDRHMISAVDLLPTLLDIAAIEHPSELDGRSFLPLLRGKSQDGRDMIFKEYNENSGAGRHPMRSVQTRRFGYIFNPWANGERVFKTATTGTMTYRAMQRLAPTDAKIAARLETFDHRVVEEFYDYENDPDALHNLIDDPEYQDEINRLRRALDAWMVKTGDHALEAFRNRDDRGVLEEYMTQVQREATARRQNRNRQATGQRPRNRGLLRLAAPASATAGQPVSVTVRHNLPANLGEQLVHVTIKNGQTNNRIDRKVLTAKGQGQLQVTFDVPETVTSVTFAVFVGKDFASNLQHLNSKRVPVK